MSDQERACLESDGYKLCKGYVNKRDGELYYLKVVTKPGVDGTDCAVYQLKNVIHYWEGDESQFRAVFET